MRNRSGISHLLVVGIILLFAGMLLAQNMPNRALIVNGKSTGVVMQMGGHAYVDVETVAQFTGGSVTLEPTRIVLNFPAGGSTASANAPTESAPAPPPAGLSRNFASMATSPNWLRCASGVERSARFSPAGFPWWAAGPRITTTTWRPISHRSAWPPLPPRTRMPCSFSATNFSNRDALGQ